MTQWTISSGLSFSSHSTLVLNLEEVTLMLADSFLRLTLLLCIAVCGVVEWNACFCVVVLCCIVYMSWPNIQIQTRVQYRPHSWFIFTLRQSFPVVHLSLLLSFSLPLEFTTVFLLCPLQQYMSNDIQTIPWVTLWWNQEKSYDQDRFIFHFCLMIN